MNNTNPPQRPLSSTSLTASNDRTPHRKQSTASLSTNHRRSNSNPNNLDTFEYVVGNNSSTSLSNNLNNNNNNNNSKRRSSLLPPLHESSSSGNNNNGNRNDPDYSSPSLPFSPYTPPTLLSQRFNHESDNEDENNASYDDDPDDSDRTEGSENTPSMAKANAAAGSSSARLRAPKRPTYGNVVLFNQMDLMDLFFFFFPLTLSTFTTIISQEQEQEERSWTPLSTRPKLQGENCLFLLLRAGYGLFFSHRHTEATYPFVDYPERIFFFCLPLLFFFF